MDKEYKIDRHVLSMHANHMATWGYLAHHDPCLKLLWHSFANVNKATVYSWTIFATFQQFDVGTNIASGLI